MNLLERVSWILTCQYKYRYTQAHVHTCTCSYTCNHVVTQNKKNEGKSDTSQTHTHAHLYARQILMWFDKAIENQRFFHQKKKEEKPHLKEAIYDN